MTITELLNQIRGQYIEQFQIALNDADENFLNEAVLRNELGKAVCEGVLGLPLRVDLVKIEESGSAETLSVDSRKIVKFSPIHFAWSKNLSVALHPFQWDSVAARISSASRKYNWKPLIKWFQKWFREEDDGEGELLGVIHFLSDPEVGKNETTFSLDLGSAPVPAFEELLDAFEKIGVRKIQFGSA